MQTHPRRFRTSLLNLLSNPDTMWAGRILFTAGVLLFTAAQLAMAIVPNRSRTVPVETDDAYTYILKAAEMQHCFLQDCPALNDLRQQLTATSENEEISWLRYREYVRAFAVYHPLHSLLLVGLHAAGLSWVASYNLIQVAGSLFVSLAVSYWLYRLFGAGPAGIALFFLAFTPFPGQGLHYIVPSNLTLGIGMLTWASLLKRTPRSGWIMLGSTLVLVLMHPIGRLYALLGVLLFVFRHARQLKRTDWLAIGLSALIVYITFLLPQIVTRPELSFPADPPPAGWTIWSGYSNNTIEALSIVRLWLQSFGGLLVGALFLVVGLLSLRPGEQRTQVLGTAVLLAGLLFASLLQILPRYPAEAFGRVWVPSAILLAGLMAHGIGRWAAALLHSSRQLLQNGSPGLTDKRRGLSRQGWSYVLLLLFGLVLLRTGRNSVLEGQRTLREVLRIMTDVQDSRLAVEQPAILLEAGCTDVLYMSEVPMHHYLVHGALECGAIYHPALDGASDEKHWIQNNPDLGYIVTWNPTIQTTSVGGGSPLALDKGDRLEFHFPKGWASSHIHVYVENPGEDTRLNISALQVKGGQKQKVLERITIPAGWSGWQAIDITAEELAQGFRLSVPEVSRSIFLRGVKADLDSLRNWPWDQGVTLVRQQKGQDTAGTEIGFDTASLFPAANLSLAVVDDQGDTVLIKVKR
jgi:hypothetical protein